MASQTSKAILAALAAEVRARPRWDEPPCLYFAYLSRDRCRLEPAAIPDTAWGDRPAHDLAALAATVSSSHAALRVKPGLYAVAFRVEAFEFDDAVPGTARFSGLIADSEAGRMETRPDRREIRAITAVDRTGLLYDVKLARHGGGLRKGVFTPDPVNGHVGTILNALDQLITALLGARMPQRRHLSIHREDT